MAAFTRSVSVGIRSSSCGRVRSMCRAKGPRPRAQQQHCCGQPSRQTRQPRCHRRRPLAPGAGVQAPRRPPKLSSGMASGRCVLTGLRHGSRWHVHSPLPAETCEGCIPLLLLATPVLILGPEKVSSRRRVAAENMREQCVCASRAPFRASPFLRSLLFCGVSELCSAAASELGNGKVRSRNS